MTAFLGYECSPKWFNYVSIDPNLIALSIPTAPALFLPITHRSLRLQIILSERELTPCAYWENLDGLGVREVIVQYIKPLSGVYGIINLVTGEMYVGSAITGKMPSRLGKHLYNLHGSRLVAEAVRLHGLHNFAFVVLEITPNVVTQEDNQELLNMETGYITSLGPVYNIALIAGNTFGVKHTPETRAAMVLNYSSERREAIGALNRGKSLSPETRAKLSQGAMGRVNSPESRALNSANSANAKVFGVARVDGKEFLSPAKLMVTSTDIRTIPAVATFLGCSEKTVRRFMKVDGRRGPWVVTDKGLANK